MALKGKAERVPIHILVGDKAMAETGTFRLLRRAMAKRWRPCATGSDARGAIAECTALGLQIEPGLEGLLRAPLAGAAPADFSRPAQSAE